MEEFRNNLLKRREVRIVVESDKNPGLEQARKMIAEEFSISEDVVAVKTLKNKFGRKSFDIDAFIYDSVEQKNMIEPKVKVKKEAKTA